MIQYPGVQKPGGSGTTRKIREQLNFTDERRWKQFSSRRLELIERFRLSERKASEQDQNVSQIATILRTEFGYPLSSYSEFEKLVTAAVQSVRRNRKRSSKNKPVLESTTNSPASSPNVSNGPQSTEAIPEQYHVKSLSSSNSPLPQENFSQPQQQRQLQTRPQSQLLRHSTQSLFTHSLPGSHDNGLVNGPHQPPVLPAIHPKPQCIPSIPSRTTSLPPVMASQSHHYDELTKTIIADLVHNRVSLHEQSRHDDFSPNLTDFALSSNDGNLLNLAFQSPATGRLSNTVACPKSKSPIESDKIPFFLRKKILLHVQRSRTCLELSSAQGSLEIYSNLAILGQSAIRASIGFVMERFFSNLSSSSVDYITSKMSSTSELAAVAVKIFKPATERHFEQMPHEAQLKLLGLIMGAIIKDFGFDPCIYPLSEIMHDVILKQYPLASQPNRDGERAAIMSTLSMIPASANKDIYRKVLLKFKDKEQSFTFHLLSNGPPSIAEILDNCRQLFQIVSQTKSLHLFHNGSVVKDDAELAKIFNKFTSEEILIEICEVKADPFDGLAILSSVSASARPTKDYQDLQKLPKIGEKSPSASAAGAVNHSHNFSALNSERSASSTTYPAPSAHLAKNTLEKPKGGETTLATAEDSQQGSPLVFQPLL
ncbi:LADA_0D11408g1_1 [Lachancea dasiensis]|uniref:LADA_0D11408g1_1 n=1 Tax=Lachancea dasiensis TaxID=1072105 RepID=A0A1G4J808_9SACH|nr:LADA_0D11408g1_1 [Lachancea dasiensis]